MSLRWSWEEIIFSPIHAIPLTRPGKHVKTNMYMLINSMNVQCSDQLCMYEQSKIRTAHRHTTSASVASKSTSFPLPSSPHCAPRITDTLLVGSVRRLFGIPWVEFSADIIEWLLLFWTLLLSSAMLLFDERFRGVSDQKPRVKLVSYLKASYSTYYVPKINFRDIVRYDDVANT